MKVLGIIPSRYNSSRFPGKPLAEIFGKSMIKLVYENAKKCVDLLDLVVATDDERISFHVKSFGGKVMMTSNKHINGTERCAEAWRNIDDHFDIIINIQGDQPLLNPNQISEIIKIFDNNPEVQIASLAKKIECVNEYKNENVVKVILNEENYANSFYRKPTISINEFENHIIYKHIGLYGFKSEIIEEIAKLPYSNNEDNLNLEQIRWMKNHYKIKIGKSQYNSHSVDRVEDITSIIELMSKNV